VADALDFIAPGALGEETATWATPADVIERLAVQGDVVPTGFPPLDRLFRRGGIPPGRVVAIGGPPGSGKTTFASMIVTAVSPRAPVSALFLDEGVEQATVKLGQQLGYDRDKLEAGDKALVLLLRGRLDGMNLRLLETDNPDVCLELAVRLAVEVEAPTRLLVLDSVQTIRATADQKIDPEEREAISAFMWLTRRLAKKHNLVVIAAAQLNRPAYSNRKTSKDINPLAMFAGSRAIEHASDVAVLLDEPDEDGVVRFIVPRNRLGEKGRFSARLDRPRASFVHVDDSAAEQEETQQAKRELEQNIGKLADRVVALLKKHGPLNKAAIYERVGGKGERVLQALDGLEAQGVAAWDPGPRGAKVWRLK
jgi:replicative DNA helicase